MKIKILIFLATSVFFLLSSSSKSAIAEEIAVVVNKDNPVETLSLEEVKDFYKNNVLTWSDGSRVVMYDLPVKHEVRKVFSVVLLGKEAKEVAREWANKKITNTAKNPPFTLKSEVLIQHKVSKSVAAIGYVRKSKLSRDKVRVVAVIK
ncbi:MAG: hypothetical protein IME96_05625 [Proteobacteria bacterium]|nr:hypothetical protein [Pseudomonadota bacterium]